MHVLGEILPQDSPLNIINPLLWGRGPAISSAGASAAARLCSQQAYILLLRSKQGRKHLVWSGCTECLVPVWLPLPHQLQTAEPKKPGNRIETAGGLAGSGDIGEMPG